MLDWLSLVRRSDFSSLDLVEVDAACSRGLPGIPERNFSADQPRVDEMAGSCARFTERVLPQFRRGRCDYPESEGKFRIQAMITHLQRDLGVRYNPACKPAEAKFRPADSFLYGILHGEGGTCGSLPILYAAVGRRLGYPIRLVTTRNHLFCRWQAEEVFNIEASGEGISFFPDEYFRTGRFEMPPQTIEMCGYLESLTPKEEVAGMMCQRAECWMQERNYNEATTSFAWAHELDPRRAQHELLTKQALKKWDESLRSRIPPFFPRIDVTNAERQFTQMPSEAELAMIRLRVAEQVLSDPAWDRRWWGPLRRNPVERPQGFPNILKVNYRWNQPAQAGSPT
jgi:hypothetical protein